MLIRGHQRLSELIRVHLACLEPEAIMFRLHVYTLLRFRHTEPKLGKHRHGAHVGARRGPLSAYVHTEARGRRVARRERAGLHQLTHVLQVMLMSEEGVE